MAQNTVSLLNEALQALYHHPDTQVRNRANKWLEEFQESQEAWQISDSLLHDANTAYDVQYFCSQTLRTKVQRDFAELPESASDSLRDSLFALLLKFKNGPGTVRTQLCLAIADLAAHAQSSKWGNGEGVVRWIGRLVGSQQDAVKSLLELLTVLPQEADSYKLALRPERRKQFLAELVDSVPDALILLQACYRASGDLISKSQVLTAFAVWIRYASGSSSTDLPIEVLVHASLEALNFPETFEAGVDALCEVIRFTVSGLSSTLAANMPLVQAIVRGLMALKPRFSAALGKNSVMVNQNTQSDDIEEDDDTIKGLARVFAELGEDYIDMIVVGSDDSLQVVTLMTEIAANREYEISSITFNFWHELSDALRKGPQRGHFEGNRSNPDEISVVEIEKERRIKIFQPYFGLLASLVSFRVQYSEDFETWRKDESEEFKQTRHSIASLLTCIADVYGGESLLSLLAQPFFKETESAASGGNWDPFKVEASLYCMRAISELVPMTEQQILPRVMELLPQLPPHPLLLYTTSLVTGAYSDWLKHSPRQASLLPPLLNFLTSVLNAKNSQDSQAAAALAFRHVCDACREPLISSMAPLKQLYDQVLAANSGVQLESTEELRVIEGICIVVNSIPESQQPPAVQALFAPIMNSIQELVLTSQQGVDLPSAQFVVQLDRLTPIFNNVQKPEILSYCFQHYWPLIQPLFRLKGGDSRIMEHLGKACKCAIRSCKEYSIPFLGSLLEEVQLLYLNHRQPCCLYVASEVIKFFGQDPNCSPSLTSLMSVMFEQTVQMLPSLADFTQRPELADDCFLMASRCVRYCPQLFLKLQVFPRIVDCALAGILVQHREACVSVLRFLADILALPFKPNGSGFSQKIEAVITPRGPSLTRLLIGGLVGGLPEYRIEEITEVLEGLSELCGVAFHQWISEVLNLIPTVVMSDSEKWEILKAVKGGCSGHLRPIFKSAVIDICDAARRNKKIMIQAQASLGF